MQTGCRKRQVGFRVREGQERVRVSSGTRGGGGECRGYMECREEGAGGGRGLQGGSPADTNSDREQWLSLLSFVLVEGTYRYALSRESCSFNARCVSFLPIYPSLYRGQYPISGGKRIVNASCRVPTTRCVNVVVIRTEIS